MCVCRAGPARIWKAKNRESFFFPTLCHPLLYSKHLWWCSISYRCLLTKMFPTLSDPMDCSLPGSSVHGFRGKNPGRIPIPFSSEYSLPRDLTQVLCISDKFFNNWAYQGSCSISQNALLSTLRFLVSSRCLLWLAFSPYHVSERCQGIQFYIPSFTFMKRLFSSSSLSPIGWCHLHIWRYWYFSWQSWFQLVLLPAQCFSWCTLHKS